MQALILAAGRGSRLGKITDTVPKCLLQVGRRPIIAHQLEALAGAGVGPVAMVVGYDAEQIREFVGIRAEYIDNPRWSVTNSLYSFALAGDWIKGPVVVLNSDVVFHPEILYRLLAAGGDAVAYDSSSGDAPEQMKVRVADGQLIDMRKDMEPGLACGENVGILCFTSETARTLIERTRAMVASGGEQDWLGSAVREIARDRRIQAVDIAGLPWVEVDCAQDLDVARREVWSAIRKGRPWLRKAWRIAGLAALSLLFMAFFTMEFRATKPSVAETWDLVELPAVPAIGLAAGDRRQMWWIVREDTVVAQTVLGPATIHLDSRLLFERGIEEPVPYLLCVEIDDVLVDWFKETGKPSQTWTHPEWTVGKLRSLSLDIPTGSHSIRVTFISTARAPACALRLKQPEPSDPD
jgi:choline kinase